MTAKKMRFGEEYVPASTDTKVQREGSAEPLELTSHIRLYASSPGRVTLQIRSHGQIFRSGEAQYDAYSSAPMGVEQAKLLRAALGSWIQDMEGGT